MDDDAEDSGDIGPLELEFGETHPDAPLNWYDEQKKPVVSEIALERTPCFGSCPAYTVILRADGTAEYEGRMHTRRLGDFVGTIPDEDFRFLASYIVEIGFDRFKPAYSAGMTDESTAYVAATIDGQRTIVEHYAPEEDGPATLRVLEHLIDRAAKRIRWTERPG